ncbi:histamine H2 receptor-like [Oculina patagonica]
MNHTTVNSTLLSCGFAILPLNPAKIFRVLHALFTVKIAVNALTCPLIILLNILLIVAVKSKRHLRNKSNTALACLATTDLMVGLVVQPLHIVSEGLLLKGEANTYCSLTDLAETITIKCCMASFHHLLLISAERYIAIKHTFQYENLVTEVRIIVASCVAWVAAILVPLEDALMTEKDFVKRLAVSIMWPAIFLFLPMIYFNVAVYKEVRRNEQQIAANQVSLEAKEKILNNKKAFYTTTIVLLVIFLCLFPVNICFVILASFRDRISANSGHIAIYLLTLIPVVLNSLFNPLIYSVRIRHFRVAFIQLLSRKTVAQAEELERKIFGPKQIGVMATVEQRQNNASRDENEQQGNGKLNIEQETAM